MNRKEAGYSYLELAVAVTIIALVVLLLMPSLQSYQANAQVRQIGEELVSAARAAELDAVSEGEIVSWVASYDNPPYVIEFFGTSEQQLATVTLPPTMHVTGSCYRGLFTPQGIATTRCGPGLTFELLCFDSNTSGNPYGFEITVVVATGQVIGNPIQGPCH